MAKDKATQKLIKEFIKGTKKRYKLTVVKDKKGNIIRVEGERYTVRGGLNG